MKADFVYAEMDRKARLRGQMMDKEAQEKIRYSKQADELYNIVSGTARSSGASGQGGRMLNWRDIAEAILMAGYRRLPKDKPPLLSDGEIGEINKVGYATKRGIDILHNVAQAQWDIWNEAIYEGINKK